MKHGKITWVLLFAPSFLVLYLYYITTVPNCVCPRSTKNNTEINEITSDLGAILSYLSDQPHVTSALLEVKHRVLRTLTKINPTYRQQIFKKSTELQSEQNIFACSENFVNASRAHPHFINGSWEVEKCNSTLPFDEVLTILLFSTEDDFCSFKLPKIVNGIRKLYPLVVIRVAVVNDNGCSYVKSIGVDFIEVSPLTSVGRVWNRLIFEVTTPFVFIARNLDYFNWFTRLERQISVFGVDSRIKVVGGSVRNKTGHWQVGCLQSRLLNYILEYKDGYYSSRNECMICDHVLGPFISRSEFIKDVKFDEYAPEEVLFEDFFLRVKNESNLVMNCPDAMYMATDPQINNQVFNRLSWIWLVESLQINRVILPDNVVHAFSCKESQVSCKNLYKTAGFLAMPICCMDAAAHGLEKFHKFCVKNNITYELRGGSVLGAVKFRDVTPWDYDGDGGYYVSNRTFFMLRERDLSDYRGEVVIDHQNEKVNGFFKISTLGFFTEMWSNKKLTWDYAPGFADFFHRSPTLMRIRGVWVNGPPNPGMYARNAYGIDMLKHVNRKGKRPQYAAYEVESRFPPCNRKFHACLDQFEVDGSFQFKFP